ncbi:enoyl-CoA hydratase-related protein [Comamonas sp. JUb58]|uniref:enoyl-CoA hydratase/isomerase family protein n=1 Tax=Comamonas sp. JUb58 TaxID=2485114 RepID=UPI0010602FDA|nr:enoyl-CoA hydratase-related protein [Comamonas sp. JUb58]TDS85082.1 enoyl-CoA hydratase/carnithine racemase [Comamonas sp. JUb58]
MAGQVRVESWTAGEAASRAQAVRVVLAHPGKRNAMSRAMWRQLRSVFEDLQRQPGLRCIVLQGEGEAFCAGGDISEYADFRFQHESLAAFHEGEVWPALHAMLQCDVPLVAAIDGACMGAGVELASCCDTRLATDRAQFGAPIAKLGFPMAPKEAALVLSQVGPAKTRQMLLEAAVFGAEQMLASGFLSQVHPAAQLQAQLERSVARICGLAPQAARMTKQLLRALAEGDAQAPVLQQPYAYADSAEHREGIAAFVAKRSPQL